MCEAAQTGYSKFLPASTLFTSTLSIPILATLVACAGAGAGLLMTGARRRARLAVPFSGGVLLGVAVLGLLPELSAEMGWVPGGVLFTAGYLILMGVDRYVYPVCPTCSHDHDHAGCAAMLHGFAGPLAAATALHSFLDGWNIAAAQTGGGADLRVTVPFAIMLHKLPEGVALGALMVASVQSRWGALGLCVGAESLTVVGAMGALSIAPVLGSGWMIYPLALAGGFFVYLGMHAVHQEWRKRGASPALVPALAGVVIAAGLQEGVHVLLR